MTLDPNLVCYLLCADEPVGHARHYLGISHWRVFTRRLLQHACGQGACLTRALASRNDRLWLARIWTPASFPMERELKLRRSHRTHCPRCNGAAPGEAIMHIPCAVPDPIDDQIDGLTLPRPPLRRHRPD